MKKDSGNKKFQDSEQKVSEQGLGPEPPTPRSTEEEDVEKIQEMLQECRKLITECKEAIDWNLEESHVQYLVAFNCGKDIKDSKDLILHLLEKKNYH